MDNSMSMALRVLVLSPGRRRPGTEGAHRVVAGVLGLVVGREGTQKDAGGHSSASSAARSFMALEQSIVRSP